MENIQLVSGHVLLPHQADWSAPPEVQRNWRSTVDTAQSGAEDRCSVRANPWMFLNYQVLPYNQVERYRFEARAREAIRIGKICVPYFGKGVAVIGNPTADDTEIDVNQSNHWIKANTYVIVQDQIPAEFDVFDVCLVTRVADERLIIDSGIQNDYSPNAQVWPLLFGRMMPNNFEPFNASRGMYKVSVQFDQRQILGHALEDWAGYPLGEPQYELNGGIGWNGPWVFGKFFS